MSQEKHFFPQTSCTHYRNEMQKHSCPEENKTSEKKGQQRQKNNLRH